MHVSDPILVRHGTRSSRVGSAATGWNAPVTTGRMWTINVAAPTSTLDEALARVVRPTGRPPNLRRHSDESRQHPLQDKSISMQRLTPAQQRRIAATTRGGSPSPAPHAAGQVRRAAGASLSPNAGALKCTDMDVRRPPATASGRRPNRGQGRPRKDTAIARDSLNSTPSRRSPLPRHRRPAS
jgi:hypothetical protein